MDEEIDRLRSEVAATQTLLLGLIAVLGGRDSAIVDEFFDAIRSAVDSLDRPGVIPLHAPNEQTLGAIEDLLDIVRSGRVNVDC